MKKIYSNRLDISYTISYQIFQVPIEAQNWMVHTNTYTHRSILQEF
jgi:hypothetical protein